MSMNSRQLADRLANPGDDEIVRIATEIPIAAHMAAHEVIKGIDHKAWRELGTEEILAYLFFRGWVAAKQEMRIALEEVHNDN